MSLAGVVLAAGRSERMGAPKALLDFRGQPFVIRILEALEALDLKPRVVVLGPDAPRIRPALAAHECVIVENPDAAGGPIGSLRAALVALAPVRPVGLLAWPVDLPQVRVTTIERLLEAYRRTGAPAVLPRFAERRGQPVLWDQALFAELATSAPATRHGARAVLRAHASELVTVAVDDPAVIDDLNTPADYERLVRQINRDIY
ncbi:MAG TPA: nucleotidyltransferase family protein [Gemmatimonadales bacterium]|nr:nucleotidyltransferase family protein [Gemmatimonadales bacterium]